MKIVKAINLLSLLLLTGCAVSQKLSPPQDGKRVKVAVVKPADVDILPMKVIYRSERCRDKILTSTGAISSRDGYHLLTVPFKPEAGSNVVSNAVAFDGGGQCGWKLSNIRFQFQFHDMTAFGQDIKKNIPNDIVFVFDEHAPPRGDGHYEVRSGAVIIQSEYYPVIMNERLIQHAKVLSIRGKRRLTYKLHDTDSIIFSPKVYSEKAVRVLGPEVFGGEAIITYPDGTKISSIKGQHPIDFEKLKLMK